MKVTFNELCTEDSFKNFQCTCCNKKFNGGDMAIRIDGICVCPKCYCDDLEEEE